MKESKAWSKLAMAALVALAGFSACFAEPDGKPVANAGGSIASEGGATGQPEAGGGAGGSESGPVCVAREATKGAQCRPVNVPTPLRQRVVENVPVDTLYFTETLYRDFNAVCGACHGGISNNLGGFHVSLSNFSKVVDEKVLAAMRSETPTCELDGQGVKKDPSCYDFMPPVGNPNGKKWSERKDQPNDPVTHLATLIEQWIAAGSPDDVFTFHDETGGPYTIDADFAETFTNLGTCIPDAGMVATELEQSCDLDAKFAALEKNPESTVPSEQVGLPATLDQTDLFTLDSAELARHGVVAYMPAYPLYTDDAGKLRYVRVPQGQSIKFNKKTKQFDIPENTRFYKIFMRKILDRDGVERYRKAEVRVIVSRPEGKSLFGTYLWNEQETQATLHTDPLNDGQPFNDHVFPIITDVARADKVMADWKAGKVRNYTKELDYQGLVRRYAVPSSERCVHCHMGGPGGHFVLGFLPLDVNPRECDQETLDAQGHCDGGIYEPEGGDHLTQLERLISYGVISDYDIKTQLISLEDPQGPRDQPRKARTPQELAAQAYMLGNCAHCHNPTGYPSVLSPSLKPLLDFRPGLEDGVYGGIFEFPFERFSPRILRQNNKVKLPYITPSLRDITGDPAHWKPKTKDGTQSNGYIDAPWRSLIYRNVDTPFTYGDDTAIFPHMPLDSPGFDCRAPRIMGEWMVSLPAVRKHPELPEEGDPGSGAVIDDDPQPYTEVKPDDPNYLNALAKAEERLDTYRNGLRGNNYCPENKDIVDVFGVVYGPYLTPRDGTVKGLPPEGVPDRVHWVVTDLTEAPGDWTPRRSDWKTKLVDQNFKDEDDELTQYTGELLAQKQANLDSQKLAVSLLHDLAPSAEFRQYIKTQLPFGLWQQKDGCDFGSQPKASDIAEPRPRWMSSPGVHASDPVYESLPGAAIFGMICVNCHGPDADATGRQAVTLQELTGGTGRVANFKQGFFGPFGMGGANRQRVFGDDGLAQHYLAWMALGGTKVGIPSLILDLVAATPVLGAQRPEAPPVTNANMLETARALCRAVVTRGNGQAFDVEHMTDFATYKQFHERTPFLLESGDGELWMKLCTFDNPAPIHGLTLVDAGGTPAVFAYQDYYNAAPYPAATPVGNIKGELEDSLRPENDFPWCIIAPTDAALTAYLETAKTSNGKPLKSLVCPAAVVDPANKWQTVDNKTPDLDRFGTRGAINAGLAVFEYLDQMISQGKGRTPGYDECETLNAASKP